MQLASPRASCGHGGLELQCSRDGRSRRSLQGDSPFTARDRPAEFADALLAAVSSDGLARSAGRRRPLTGWHRPARRRCGAHRPMRVVHRAGKLGGWHDVVARFCRRVGGSPRLLDADFKYPPALVGGRMAAMRSNVGDLGSPVGLSPVAAPRLADDAALLSRLPRLAPLVPIRRRRIFSVRAHRSRAG